MIAVKKLTKYQKYRKKLYDSFAFFLKEVWRLKPPEVLPEPHWLQYDIANWLQYGPKQRGVRGTRGLSKTWTTCAYILWRLYRNPIKEKVVLCSATPGNSKESLLMIRAWIEYIPFLQHLKPRKDDPRLDIQWRDSAESVDVGPCIPEKAPSIRAMGILSALSSTRATLIVPDDIEQDNNTQTRVARVLLDSRTEEFDHILLEGGDIIYLGTDHHEESVYEKLEEKGYTFRAWPMRYPTSQEAKNIPGLAPEIVKRLKNGANSPGDSIWPERWSDLYIASKELATPHSFKMQRMLIRGLGNEEMYPLKLSDLIVYESMQRDQAPVMMAWGKTDSKGSTAIEDIPSVGFGHDQFYGPVMINEKWAPYQGCKAFLDPASKGADEMAWAIIAQLHGYLYGKYVMGLGGADTPREQRGATQENLEQIVLSLKEHDARELWIETNFGGEFLIPLIEPIVRKHTIMPGEDETLPMGWSCAVEGIPAGAGMKEDRIINNLASAMQAHRLIISPQVARCQKTMYQMTRMKRERNCLDHEDRIEALAGAVAQFKDFLHQDASTVENAEKRESFEKKMEKYAKLRGETLQPAMWNAY